MMHKQSGFSVIEMVISMMLSAMLMTAALTIYNQISKSMNKVETLTNNDSAIMIFHNRINQDLAGLCPLWLAQKSSEKKTKETPSDNPTASKEQKPLQENNTEQTTHEQSQSGVQALFLYAPEKKDSQTTQYITFITSNPLQTYPAQGQQAIRVVYKIESDPSQPTTLLVQRKQESSITTSIDPEKILEGSFYTLVSSVQSVRIEYGFIETSPEERKKNPDQPWNLKWVSSWGSADKTSSENYIPVLPDVIRIKIALIRIADQKTFEYELYNTVPVCKEKPLELIKVDSKATSKMTPPVPKEGQAENNSASESGIPIVAIQG